MRQIVDPQLQLGQIGIGDVQLDLGSRDDIPQLLRGLQLIYTNPDICKPVFNYLNHVIPAEVDTTTGRPGMALWTILVLGTLRLNLNCDYDRVMELANEHATLRKILGHGLVDANDKYRLQTIKDNLRLLTPEILDGINQIVVSAGHELLGCEKNSLAGRCDSFVVETDVHYPTDINLLNDAMRKVISLCGNAAQDHGVSNWRQYDYNYHCVNNLYRKARNRKSSSSKNPLKVEQRQAQIEKAHQSFIDCSNKYLQRALHTVTELQSSGHAVIGEQISHYIAHAERQIDQIERRVIKGEKIPHEEKVFSIFEEHTEWVVKGKAGVPVELGLRVCILEDTCGFILHHQVMEKQTDEQVTVVMVEEAKARFPSLRLCSFDKGFYTRDNREVLDSIIEKTVLPKKGKWSNKDREIESEKEFIQARKQHSAVESAINALEVHGLDRCSDHGIDGFKRYVALAVLGRNIQKLGTILLAKEKEDALRKTRKIA